MHTTIYVYICRNDCCCGNVRCVMGPGLTWKKTNCIFSICACNRHGTISVPLIDYFEVSRERLSGNSCQLLSRPIMQSAVQLGASDSYCSAISFRRSLIGQNNDHFLHSIYDAVSEMYFHFYLFVLKVETYHPNSSAADLFHLRVTHWTLTTVTFIFQGLIVTMQRIHLSSRCERTFFIFFLCCRWNWWNQNYHQKKNVFCKTEP